MVGWPMRYRSPLWTVAHSWLAHFCALQLTIYAPQCHPRGTFGYPGVQHIKKNCLAICDLQVSGLWQGGEGRGLDLSGGGA